MTWWSLRPFALGRACVVILVGLLTGCTMNIGTPQVQPTTRAQLSSPTETSRVGYASWADAIAATETGVAQIVVEACDGIFSGTAFLVAPDQLVTAAHVVDGASRIDVLLGGQTVTATVIGFNDASDIALVRTDTPLSGFVFHLASDVPRKGEEVTALGYPAKTATVVATQGRVSGLDQVVETDAFYRNDMIEVDAGVNHGNSGGPLITQDGTVVGVVSASSPNASVTGFAAPAPAAGAEVSAWQATPQDVAFAACRASQLRADWSPGSLDTPTVDVLTNDPGAYEVADVLARHGTAINSGDYAAGYADFTPPMQEYVGSLDGWATAMEPIYWVDVSVLGVSTREDGVYLADVELVRFGDPDVAGACGIWTKRYTIKSVDGRPFLRIGWVEDVADPRGCE